MTHRIVTLESGRQLGVSAVGDPFSCRLVLLCHPTPGAGGFDPNPAITASRGVHLIVFDRPRHIACRDRSDDRPYPVECSADDLAEILEERRRKVAERSGKEFGPVGVIGWGAGGAVALSLAARHPDLVDRVVVVNTPRPRHSGAAFRERARARGESGQQPSLMGAYKKSGIQGWLGQMLAEAQLREPEAVGTNYRMLADRGWARDLGRIRASVLFVYGDAAHDASARDGHWYQWRVRGSRVVRVPGEGALTIINRWCRILAHVAPQHDALPGAIRG